MPWKHGAKFALAESQADALHQAPGQALPSRDAYDLSSGEPLQCWPPRHKVSLSLSNNERHPSLREIDPPHIDTSDAVRVIGENWHAELTRQRLCPA